MIMLPAAVFSSAAAEKPPDDAIESAATARWLVFFGEDWGRHNSTGQYLALALAAVRGDRLLWVNSLGLRQPRLDRADLGRAWSKLVAAFRGRSAEEQSVMTGPPVPAGVELHVTTQLALPFLRAGWVRRLNRLLVGLQLRRLQRRHGISAPVLVTACPATADVLDILAPAATFYYCADEHAELPGMDAALVHGLERDLLGRVDAVLATSRALLARKRELHPRVYYLPHAVDGAHFRQALDAGLPVPPEIARLPGPRVGYVGLIGRHLDLDRITATAAAVPNASLILIGPVETGLSGLPRADNIHYLGPRAYAELPACMQAFDVCLLPWNDSARNRYAHPSKVREYLAAGCPVVASPHAELAGIGPHIHVGATPERFARIVADLLADPPGPTERRRIAASVVTDSWDQRARVVQALLAGTS